MGREKLTRIDDRGFDYWCFLQEENMLRVKVEKLINSANRQWKTNKNRNKCYRYSLLWKNMQIVEFFVWNDCCEGFTYIDIFIPGEASSKLNDLDLLDLLDHINGIPGFHFYHQYHQLIN